jgi:hypothetical protein
LLQIVVPVLLVALILGAMVLALPGKGLLARHSGGPPSDPGNGVPWNQPKPNDEGLQPSVARHSGGPPADPGNGVPWNQPKPNDLGLQPSIARHSGGPPSDPGNGVPWNQPKPSVLHA